jgi:hypothetical protein
MYSSQLTDEQCETFIKNLKRYRVLNDLKFDDLAKNFGLSRAFFSQLFYRKSKPSEKSIAIIVKKTKIPREKCINGEIQIGNLQFNQLDYTYSEENIGKRIENIRKTYESKEKFSEVVGLSMYKVNQMIKGKEINLDRLFKIAYNCNVNLEYLLGFTINKECEYSKDNYKFNNIEFKKVLKLENISPYSLTKKLYREYHIFIDEAAIYRWIQGNRSPRLELLFYLKRILKFDLNQMLGVPVKTKIEEKYNDDKFRQQKLIYELKDLNEKLSIIINSFIFGDIV